jgi:hypothetical protein
LPAFRASCLTLRAIVQDEGSNSLAKEVRLRPVLIKSAICR